MSMSHALPCSKHVLHAFIYIALGVVLSFLCLDDRVVQLFPLLRRGHVARIDGLQNFRGEADAQQLLELTREADHFIYLKEERILAAVTAKGGSTSFWQWLFVGVTGQTEFNCTTYVQNVRAMCWKDRAVPLIDLPEERRMFVLTDPSVLRVAVWRDPFERIISCWKSKFACEAWTYGTDYPDRERMVPELRKIAALPETPCLNISQYADTLDHIRSRIVVGAISIRDLNPHIRPQSFFFGSLNYSLILDVRQLSNARTVSAITDRLPYASLAGTRPQHLHESKGVELVIPESAAISIAKFATLTEPVPRNIVPDSFGEM